MSEQNAKRFKKSNDAVSETAKYDIAWQNNFLRWEGLMRSRVHNATFEDKFFIVRRGNQIMVLQFPAITYRQLARLKSSPNVIPFNPRKLSLTDMF
jgi:hypothetical protein